MIHKAYVLKQIKTAAAVADPRKCLHMIQDIMEDIKQSESSVVLLKHIFVLQLSSANNLIGFLVSY